MRARRPTQSTGRAPPSPAPAPLASTWHRARRPESTASLVNVPVPWSMALTLPELYKLSTGPSRLRWNEALCLTGTCPRQHTATRCCCGVCDILVAFHVCACSNMDRGRQRLLVQYGSYGSEADVTLLNFDVHFSPNSGQAVTERPLWAKRRHSGSFAPINGTPKPGGVDRLPFSLFVYTAEPRPYAMRSPMLNRELQLGA